MSKQIYFGFLAVMRDVTLAFTKRIFWEDSWMLDSSLAAREQAGNLLKYTLLVEKCADLCALMSGGTARDVAREFARQLRISTREEGRDFLNAVATALELRVH